MKLNSDKAWVLGFSVITFFVIASELTVTFDDYIYQRLGLNRNAILMVLWTLPCLASYMVSYYSKDKLLLGLSFIPILPLMGSIVHYINSNLGCVVDFTGMPGAISSFKIYLAMGSMPVITGTILGIFFSKS